MAFQPAGSLNNRTFFGLIVAQFLAGFNDQAIHAMAMFYAIHTAILTEANAITLMPILFFAPWAIFCTLAGYLADRYQQDLFADRLEDRRGRHCARPDRRLLHRHRQGQSRRRRGSSCPRCS